MSIGFIIPAYRPDTNRLAQYVRSINKHLPSAIIRIELDAPAEDVVEALSDVPATVNTAPCRRGKGAAITAGFEALSTDILAFADADGATPAPEVISVIEAITHGDADLAVGSRRHPDASVITHQTSARRFLGDGFAWLARHLLSVKLYDYQCGTKAITADGWKQVRTHLYEPGFGWDIELIAIAGGLDLRVVEVPVQWEDKPGSTVSPISDSISLLRTLSAAWHRTNRLNNDPFHTTIAGYRDNPVKLVNRDQ